MSVLLSVVGVLTYYVAPTAFLYEKFDIFYGICNVVLLMMILGMTFISLLVLPPL
jgi:hypothetical protein